VSLYLTIPPSDIHRTRPLSRLLLNQIVSRLTETLEVSGGQAVPPYPHRLLLMLDEFPTLGRMEVIQTALAYLAGYGIKAYLIVQDLTQLSHAYGRYESIISNCHVRVAFAANKVETARLISDMVGTMTVHREARSYTGSRLTPVLPRVTASEQDSARPLLTPDEILRLPAAEALIFVAGHPPIYGRKIRYYEDPVFRARAALPPPPASDRLAPEGSVWAARGMTGVAPPAEEAEPLPAVSGARSPDPPGGDRDWDLT
jgi:type IV secretion system protein VirD4